MLRIDGNFSDFRNFQLQGLGKIEILNFRLIGRAESRAALFVIENIFGKQIRLSGWAVCVGGLKFSDIIKKVYE